MLLLQGSHDSDRPPSPKFARTRSVSASSQSDRGRSSSPEERSFSGSDSDARGKSSSPARSNASGKSDRNTSIQIKNLSTRPGGIIYCCKLLRISTCMLLSTYKVSYFSESSVLSRSSVLGSVHSALPPQPCYRTDVVQPAY